MWYIHPSSTPVFTFSSLSMLPHSCFLSIPSYSRKPSLTVLATETSRIF